MSNISKSRESTSAKKLTKQTYTVAKNIDQLTKQK